MELVVGNIVSLEDSDTLWVVQSVDKGQLTLLDAKLGVIEIDAHVSEVTEVLGMEE